MMVSAVGVIDIATMLSGEQNPLDGRDSQGQLLDKSEYEK